VRRSLAWGGPLAGEEFVITNSCTEALGLCLRAVTKPGDTVAVESPAYYLMLQLLETLGLKALEIPTDPRTGMSVEALDLASRQAGNRCLPDGLERQQSAWLRDARREQAPAGRD
jgi:DNA-binding transcriptional MocR family regulator